MEKKSKILFTMSSHMSQELKNLFTHTMGKATSKTNHSLKDY